MRNILLISFLFFCSLARSQDFEILNKESQLHHGNMGQDIHARLRIINHTFSPLSIIVERIESKIGPSQVTYFCKADQCFDKATDQLPTPLEIAPGAISEHFTSVLKTGIREGSSTVKYAIYDRANPEKKVYHEVIYFAEAPNKRKALYQSDEILVSILYPNPVTDIAMITYDIREASVEAKIIIHNVLGITIDEYTLSQQNSTLKINTAHLNQGVFFYTLYLNGDGKTN